MRAISDIKKQASLSMASNDQSKLNDFQLTNERKKQLRAIGHTLKPVVTVASGGLHDSVLAEINRALEDHELIKVKISVGDRELKQQTITDVCKKCGAQLIQTIGNIALILREAKKTNPPLSNLKRTKLPK